MPKPTYPCPPRFWWLKRITLGWLIVIALLLIIRLIWGWEINRRMNNQLAEWRAQGQPTRPEDFAELDVPDEENAALILKRIEITEDKAYEEAIRRDEVVLPLSAAAMQAIEFYRAANWAALRQVRSIRKMPAAKWGYRVTENALGYWDVPTTRAPGELAGLLHSAALRAHAEGNDADAAEFILDLFRVHQIASVQPSLIEALIARHYWQHACATVTQIACDFNAGSAKAEPEAVRSILAALLDHTAIERQYLRGLHAERCRLLGLYRLYAPEIAGGRYPYHSIPGRAAPHEQAMAWLIAPAIDTMALRDMRELTAIADRIRALEAVPAANRQRQGAMLGQDAFALVTRIRGLSEYTNQISGWRVLPNRLSLMALQHRTDANAAAISLAVRLYRLDHGGYPARLDQLAPAYVPAIPVDPFAGKPFRYEPAADPPFLLSVGENEVDDLAAGRWQPKEWSSNGNWATDRPDAIYPLTRTSKPSGQKAVEKGDGKADDNMQPSDPGGQKEKP